MKSAMLAGVLATVMVAGCVTTQKSYQTTTTVTPAGQGQYTVGWTIQATEENGNQSILSTPTVTVPAGTEGEIKVCDEKQQDGVFCTALVNETPNGLETLTTVTVKEKGKTTLNTSQKTLVKK
jgi:type II secretory pathway component GspD/PulD (secretin)